jgi:molybdopterin/thiamine biosynthesis adenylyltransferase
MEKRLYIPKKHSAEYLLAREAVNKPTLETVEARIYHGANPEQWEKFNDSLSSFPQRKGLLPWTSADPEQIRLEAIERRILRDRFPNMLQDIAKRKKPKDYWKDKPGLLKRYVSLYDRPESQTFFEFDWTVEGAYVVGANEREMRETMYASLIQDDPRLFTPEDFAKAGEKKVLVIGAGVGSSDADLLVEFGLRDITVIDGGDVELHDFGRLPNAGMPTIGMNHAELWAQNAKERYPYGNFQYYKQNIGDGTNGTKHREELIKKGKFDLIIEVVDNVVEKVLDREVASEQEIPVWMTTDVLFGNVMTVQPGRKGMKIFPRLNDEDRNKITSGKETTFVETSELAQKLVGPRADYWVTGAKEGRSNWSQNAAQTAASKVALAYTLRRWLRNQPLEYEKEFAIEDGY